MAKSTFPKRTFYRLGRLQRHSILCVSLPLLASFFLEKIFPKMRKKSPPCDSPAFSFSKFPPLMKKAPTRGTWKLRKKATLRKVSNPCTFPVCTLLQNKRETPAYSSSKLSHSKLWGWVWRPLVKAGIYLPCLLRGGRRQRKRSAVKLSHFLPQSFSPFSPHGFVKGNKKTELYLFHSSFTSSSSIAFSTALSRSSMSALNHCLAQRVLQN